MRIMKFTCTLVTIAGCLRPLSWTSLFKRTAYNVYRLYIIVMLYTFTLSQFMDIAINVENPDDFTNNVYMTLNVSATCCKVLVMWINHANITMLINCFIEEPFKPLDPNEMKIQWKFEKIIRSIALRYMILIGVAWTSIFVISLFTDFRQRRLTYREWVPFDYSSYMRFCFTYAQQMLSTLHCANVNISCDALFCGLLMQVCCQIEILEYRLKKISSNQDIVGYCIRHHNRIIKFAQLLNTKFTQIIGFQFVASTLIICCALFQMSKSLSINHISLIMYTSCMLIQIFIYCWFGNKVKSRSLQLTDHIYEMEWPMLGSNVKKSLLIIMKRAEVPIEICTARIVPINLDSFVAILKTSYSAYNLLGRV